MTDGWPLSDFIVFEGGVNKGRVQIIKMEIFSFATDSYIYETDFTLQKYHF